MRAGRRRNSYSRRRSVLARRRRGLLRARSGYVRRRAAAQGRGGFALLMSLMVIALAAAALAGLARRSTVAALDARGAAERLQRRWAVVSCRETLLNRAEAVLAEAEGIGIADGDNRKQSSRKKPVARVRVNCKLAGIPYELVFTDEQAKFNPNSILTGRGRAEAEGVVSRLSGVRRVRRELEMTVKLRTVPLTVSSNSSVEALPPVGGYGQMFRNASPELLAGDRWHAGAADEVTCWSDGRVNVRRASIAAIKAACDKQVDPRLVRWLLSGKAKDPFANLEMMLTDGGKTDAAGVARLAARLTDQSSCHGLWIIAKTRQRRWYAFSVLRGIADGKANTKARATGRRRYDFVW